MSEPFFQLPDRPIIRPSESSITTTQPSFLLWRMTLLRSLVLDTRS